MRSIKERSVSNEEMGMFWRDLELSWWWYPRSDRDAGGDDRGVRGSDGRPRRPSRTARSGCSSRSRRRTGRRPRPRPTPFMPCSCAARTCWLPTPWSRWSSAEQTIKPEKVEAGTGFYEQRFVRRRNHPENGRNHRQEGRQGRGLGQRPLAVPGGHEQGHAL